ncbi:hypothetical protein HYPSUDRAFT_1078854 [Hypholoma sublateritium FD-334 SS-4]|uniref:DUF7918 domain-containing protein n=1 Tax=Hypholoma sublateritium (strain FD-334 SS-4) TaxID=945553 RepID=A0A0D2KG40_HYPSF|nr:hypothetical protein HYPSUDRAFT_1078854 [Hypholoma sublateritium FD-334 SS-4]
METSNDMLSGDGFSAWISVDGVPCAQYAVQYQEGDAVAGPNARCWIASTANKSFSIHIRKEQDDSDYRAMVYLDGHAVVNSVFHKMVTSTRTISTIWISDYETRNLNFAALDITDDDSCLENPPLRNIGYIRVVMTRGKRGEFLPEGREHDIENLGKVHERLKTGLSHRVKYGPAEQAAVKRTCCQYEVQGKPVTFLFRYRPLDVLQANEIAPRIGSQSEDKANDVTAMVKGEGIINVNSDDEKERELLAQLESVRNRKRAKQNNGLPKKKVKAEANFVPGEVIDLTI